jgi:hypothetical protein
MSSAQKRPEREYSGGRFARMHEPIPILATIPAEASRSRGRQLQALAVGVLVLLLAGVAALLILAERAKDRQDARLAGVARMEAGEPSQSSSLIAIEPARFPGLQGPVVPQLPFSAFDAPADEDPQGALGAAPDQSPQTSDAAPGSSVEPSLVAADTGAGAEPAVQADDLVTAAGAVVELPVAAPTTEPQPEAKQPAKAQATGRRTGQEKAGSPQPAPDPGSKIDATLLMARGNQFLAHSDVSSARLFFRLAAEQGSPAGAMAMAASFDPLALSGPEMRGVRPDPKAAVQWYRRAAALGEASAEARVARLIDDLNRRAAGGDAEARGILSAIGR